MNHESDKEYGRYPTDTEVFTLTEMEKEQFGRMLCQNFNRLELRDLAAGIGLRLKEPANPVDRDLARELLQEAETANRLRDLVDECYDLRPGPRWSKFS
ncbi:MAG: hypothetical protein KBE23_02450 [Chloroflexi bacterium]|nr:hypothetical protein [Chloroflexota bacterium]MBP7041573.1 hypothetical protein [Chloroflexota bacterium]